MRSVMRHRFSEVPRVDIPRSSFDRSHGVKSTFDADWLVPVLVDDIIPGDTFNVNMSFFCRLSTPLYPIMDNMRLTSFFFFVPYRLLWSNWERFCGAQDDPGDTTDYTIPAIASATTQNITDLTQTNNALWNYMGLPYKSSVNLAEISVLPMRAYSLIWDEWFRDENLQNAQWKDGVFGTDYGGNGPDLTSTHVLKKRGKRHDYFTSCLPWPQKSTTQVSLPIGDSAPIYYNGSVTDMKMGESTDKTPQNITSLGGFQAVSLGTVIQDIAAVSGTYPTDVAVYADLTNATAATINDLRLAFQTQRLLERDARSGTRYTETLVAHWGVHNGDLRLFRPEFLGGGSTPINITPVPNTTSIDSLQDPATKDRYPGQLAAFGTASGTHGFTKSFTEHGVLIGLVNVEGDITYCQGLDRMWSKSTRYDFYYPVLSTIGEQAVLNSEIYYQNSAADDTVFGYQERYAEYRYKPSRLTGLFNVDHASTLSAWHLAEDFASLPTLGSVFIEANTGAPLDRAIAVPTEPHFIGDFYFDMKCARPMPLFGVPGSVDHF